MNNYGRREALSFGTSGLMSRVFAWQTAGLLLSTVVALFVAGTPTLITMLLKNKILLYGLMIAQVGAVFWLSASAHKMSFNTMAGVYLAYAGLTGATLSIIFVVYTMSSIAMCFGIAAGMFGVMALYGYLTKADLSGFGSIMFMGLIGILIASLVNIFMRSETAGYVISFLSVLVFTGLTAYDIQKIKHFGESAYDNESLRKASILGALTLYLDFINIFLSLLHLLGGRRRD